ncbi:hypothetical protein [Saccharopolyspora shandongensis]|uniref:hypothetical protein n=1 Tax=Saccharopolyspora shandongensis TaxID=418495 RepID=UPI0015A7025F|nr:hypothetical protein [Saccharopolyspora shandongensis]
MPFRIPGGNPDLRSTTAELGLDEAQLGLRPGFGALLGQDVLDGYRKRARSG